MSNPEDQSDLPPKHDAASDFEQPTGSEKTSITSWSFVLFMLALTALFAYLGNWQVNRLAQKEAMVSAIEERIANEPIQLPPLAEWVGFDPQTYEFRPVVVTGIFDHDKSVRIFTFLADANGQYSGPGYWIVAPFMLEQGGVLFVNRGFVPEELSSRFADGGAGPQEEVTISGIGRKTEAVNTFTPGADFENRIDWVRNIERLSQFIDSDMGRVAPIYMDISAGEEGALPQGGETKLMVINKHFEYALTWFALALLTPMLLVVWWWKGARTATEL